MRAYVLTSGKDFPAPRARYQEKRSAIMLALPGSTQYEALSRYIVGIFHNTYGANIEVTYPLLMGLVDAEQNPLAALGVRSARQHSPLFLEKYLDQPVENYLQATTGSLVSRLTIAEAGNLSSSGKGIISMLLYALACHLDQEGMSHVLFTGTSLLKRYLNNIGLFPDILAEADPAKLGAGAALWGSYYETRPKVMAGNVKSFRIGLESYFRKYGMSV